MNDLNEEENKNINFSNKKILTDKLRENPWILSTVVFGVMAVVLLVATLPVSLTGNVVSEDIAAQKIMNILEQTGVATELVNITSTSGVYEIMFMIDGEPKIVYVTKDGELWGPLFPLKDILDFNDNSSGS